VFRAGNDAELYALVVIALINRLMAAYYYLRLMVDMYVCEPVLGAPRFSGSRWETARAAISSFGRPSGRTSRQAAYGQPKEPDSRAPTSGRAPLKKPAASPFRS
jgi:hypothetical protein